MTNRRTFIQSTALAASVATVVATGLPVHAGDTAQLPKLRNGCRLLFQGDSITDMKWGRNQRDRNHYLGHSYVYLIAARLGVEMPTAELEFFNRGHSGNTVGDLRKRWQVDAVAIKPDVLSVLIGVNDVGRAIRAKRDHVALAEWERDYREILDASRRTNPNLKIVFLDPFVLPSKRFDNGQYVKWRAETDKLGAIVSKLAADYQATHVQTQRVFDDASKIAPSEHWIWDGVHPLPQGHELIAREWIKQATASF